MVACDAVASKRQPIGAWVGSGEEGAHDERGGGGVMASGGGGGGEILHHHRCFSPPLAGWKFCDAALILLRPPDPLQPLPSPLGRGSVWRVERRALYVVDVVARERSRVTEEEKTCATFGKQRKMVFEKSPQKK